MIRDRETYLFDLRGYVVLEGALSGGEVAELNRALDQIPRLQPGEWYGHVHGHTYGTKDGLSLQQIYEAGEPFERLIDHPSWFEHLKLFVGGEGSFDYHHGPLFIDECFAHFRGPGEAIVLHSGGFPPEGGTAAGIEGSVEVHLQAGDALVFVDGISHGSARRVNEGERRAIIFRYGPSWGNFRHAYQPSPELLARLTPERRRIVQPLDPLPREPNLKEGA
jgi:hypothetical protein